MVLSQTQFYILLAANIPLYWFMGWLFFSTWGGLWECIKYWFKPDIASLIEGELSENFWAQMKIIWWIIACGACIYGELQLIEKFFGS
jgi:hypothetical protein